MLRSMRTLALGLLFLLLPALVTAAAAPSAPSAPPALYWERVSPLPNTADLLGAAYGNGLYVAVGKYGTVLTSVDGETWAPRPTGTDHHFTAVTYGAGRFVALGSDGAGLTSPDGSAWTLHATHLTAEPLDMAYGNGRYVAVGMGGWTAVSVDGQTWRSTTSGVYTDLRGIAFGFGRFVAVGGNGLLLTSTDGETWELIPTGVFAYLHDVAFGDGQFLAVGAPGTTLRSTDGIHWDVRTDNTAQIPVYLAGNQVVAEHNDSDAAPPNPTWKRGYEARPVDFYRVVYGTHGFVVADSSRYFTTTDGLAWKPHYSPDNAPLSPQLLFGNGRYLALGWFGQTAVSTDGAQWRQTSQQVWLNRAAYGAGRYVAVGRDGQRRSLIATSSDGKTWQTRTVDGVGELYAVTYAAGRFVAVGDAVITSTDGLRWETRVPARGIPNDYFAGVAYGNERFVAVGNTGDVLISSDGVNWTRHYDREMGAQYGLGFGNGLFVAFGPGLPDFRTSEDGVHWSKHPLPAGYSLWNVAYGNGAFVFIAHDNQTNLLLTTRNFRTYTEARPVSQQWEPLDAVAYADGRFVAVGDRYGMAVSADGIEWELAPYTGEQRSLVAAGGGRIVTLTHFGSAWVSRSTPPADAVLSTVTARQIALPIEERLGALVTVTLRDGQNLRLAGRRVRLESSTGERMDVQTDPNGTAYFVVTGLPGEMVSYRVRVDDDEVYLAETARIHFTR